jgi:hypothetical protein
MRLTRRNVVIGLTLIFGCSPLQWGRRVNTAEWRARAYMLRASLWLQWGRRVNTAECVDEDGLRRTVRMQLQWGRRVNTAE